jgi:hypothetical protein
VEEHPFCADPQFGCRGRENWNGSFKGPAVYLIMRFASSSISLLAIIDLARFLQDCQKRLFS